LSGDDNKQKLIYCGQQSELTSSQIIYRELTE